MFTHWMHKSSTGSAAKVTEIVEALEILTDTFLEIIIILATFYIHIHVLLGLHNMVKKVLYCDYYDRYYECDNTCNFSRHLCSSVAVTFNLYQKKKKLLLL